MTLSKIVTPVIIAFSVSLLAVSASRADKVDDVINAGVVRCGVVLDFPPIGYRDANNEPAGFDVEYCKGSGKGNSLLNLKISADHLGGAFAGDRDHRADVVFGGTSDSLERAKTVGFTIPYAIYYAQAVIGKDSGITSF